MNSELIPYAKFLKYKIIFVAIVSISSFSVFANEGKKIEPTGNYCSKATSLSTGMAEHFARIMGVPVSSVRLLAASGVTGGNECFVTVAGPNNARSCRTNSVFSNGKDFWISGSCY